MNEWEFNALLVESEDKDRDNTKPMEPAEVYGQQGLWILKELKADDPGF